eukprot:gene5313-6457_t
MFGVFVGALSSMSPPSTALETPTDELQIRARDLETALNLFDEIVASTPSDPIVYERRGQILVDLKRFTEAIADFNKSTELSPANYVSLGLLANRGLAFEGVADWRAAIRDYTKAVDLGREIGASEPYILNSRGNCYASIGEYDKALEDYTESANVFSGMRNISGTIYSSSNAALVRVQLGDEETAITELKKVARRAPGSIDMRAALAAIYWGRGEETIAEEYWGWACDKINSGQVTENGPVLD